MKKVFLFGDHGWLYCSNVTFNDGVYRGWVENGAWHLRYNTDTRVTQSFNSVREKEPVTEFVQPLTWMCSPKETKFKDYNEVIAEAEERYKSGEASDNILVDETVDPEYALYLKLKAKYEPLDEECDDIPF
jgi:hypothetical protein